MDYKWALQMKAEEIAEEQYGVDFYSLSPAEQSQVYERGMNEYHDDLAATADYFRKAEREG